MLTALILSIFTIGYGLIVFEHKVGVNKTVTALFTASFIWIFAFQIGFELDLQKHLLFLQDELGAIFQIVLFLLGTLAIVETINAHRGFNFVSSFLKVSSKKRFLWVVSFVAFFLSSVLDNLTTTIVMVSLIGKILPDRNDRIVVGSAIVIGANAGGAWTPIGDVTTTMLWIGGQITASQTILSLFWPSLACLLVATLAIQPLLQGEMEPTDPLKELGSEPCGKLVLITGVLSLIFVPIFKGLTGLPPFMGVLLGLGILWLITDVCHKNQPGRNHLKMDRIIRKIDVPSVLFFLGILLAVSALDEVGILAETARFLDRTTGNPNMIAVFIGVLSAVVDNVPLVAAAMGMYDLDQFAVDSSFWQLTAYAAGTGGSMLIIGSAAGVVFMGMEKVEFFDYLKRFSLPAALGYFAGVAVYFLQAEIFG